MSKNTYLVFLILSLFAAGLTFYYGSTKASASLGKNLPVVVPASQYIANDLGVAFDYPAGANGYALKQPNMSIVPNLERLVVLSKKSDNVFNTIAGVSLEEPPTITLTVYKNLKTEQPSDWADSHKMYSNIELKTSEPANIVIGGANAIRYTTSGIYHTDNVVIARAEYIYVFSGAYLDEDSEIHKDFLELLGSIEFVPTKDQI